MITSPLATSFGRSGAPAVGCRLINSAGEGSPSSSAGALMTAA